MIEAVNSVLSNAPASRVAAEQQTSTRSFASNPEKTQEAAKTPYISPYIAIDRNYNKAILQIRDSETGDVVRQFPTEGQLKAYRAAQQFSERQKAQADSALRAASGSSTPQQATQIESPVVADVAAPTASSDSSSVNAAPTSLETEA